MVGPSHSERVAVDLSDDCTGACTVLVRVPDIIARIVLNCTLIQVFEEVICTWALGFIFRSAVQ